MRERCVRSGSPGSSQAPGDVRLRKDFEPEKEDSSATLRSPECHKLTTVLGNMTVVCAAPGVFQILHILENASCQSSAGLESDDDTNLYCPGLVAQFSAGAYELKAWEETYCKS